MGRRQLCGLQDDTESQVGDGQAGVGGVIALQGGVVSVGIAGVLVFEAEDLSALLQTLEGEPGRVDVPGTGMVVGDPGRWRQTISFLVVSCGVVGIEQDGPEDFLCLGWFALDAEEGGEVVGDGLGQALVSGEVCAVLAGGGQLLSDDSLL